MINFSTEVNFAWVSILEERIHLGTESFIVEAMSKAEAAEKIVEVYRRRDTKLRRYEVLHINFKQGSKE